MFRPSEAENAATRKELFVRSVKLAARIQNHACEYFDQHPDEPDSPEFRGQVTEYVARSIYGEIDKDDEVILLSWAIAAAIKDDIDNGHVGRA